MRKPIFAVLLIAAACGLAAAQQSSTATTTAATSSSASESSSTSPQQQGMSGDTPNMGRAPSAINEIGRLDLRVMDEAGQPVSGAKAELTSIWTNKNGDREKCVSYGPTDARGAIALPPIHMGTLELEVEAKGYQKQRIPVALNSLTEPVKVTLMRKK